MRPRDNVNVWPPMVVCGAGGAPGSSGAPSGVLRGGCVRASLAGRTAPSRFSSPAPPSGKLDAGRESAGWGASGAFTFVTPEETTILYRLDPNVTPDGQSLVSTKLEISGSTQTYTIERRTPISAAPTVLLANAGRLQLSPDGTKMVFTNYADA